MDDDASMVDWDYWPYLWLVYVEGQLAIKDFNGWYFFLGQYTLGM